MAHFVKLSSVDTPVGFVQGDLFGPAAEPVATPAGLVQHFRKSTAIVHMYPIRGSYGHYCRRVYNALLVIALRVWGSLDDDYRSRVLGERRVLRFCATVAEVRRVLRDRAKSNIRVYEAIDELYKMECRFDVMGEGNALWRVSSRLISQWARPEGDTGEVQWEYPPDVFELLMRPMPYAIIDLRLANSLSSGHALALYENTNRYVSNPSRLTKRLPVEEWTRLIVTTQSAARYAQPGNYRDFKREVLKPAMAELAKSDACPIVLELLETRAARNRVTHLQFKVELKRDRLPTELGQTGDPRLAERMRRWGVTEVMINRLLVSTDPEELEYYIRAFEARVVRGEPIRNLAGAFVDSVNKRYEAEAYAAEKAKTKQAHKQVLALQAQADDQARARAHEQRARQYFESQPPGVRQMLVDAFLATQQDNAVLQTQYRTKGLQAALVAAPFYAWLAEREGVIDGEPGDSP